MKLGAERQKVMLLVGLLVVAGAVYFFNSSPSESDTGGYVPRTTATPAASATPGQTARPVNIANRRQRTLQEFRPSLKPKRPEDRPDPMSIDPTLRLDLLAKLQQVNVEGTHRSIFDFGQAPPPKAEEAKKLAAGPKVPSPIAPVAAETPKPADTKPQAPPIPLKFYGYISPAGEPEKRAFFMEGEEIHVVHEGELVKSRYKIVRIGVNSVVVEDTKFSSQQTLPLEEQQG